MWTKYMIRFISVAQAHAGLVDNVSGDCLHQTPNMIESPAKSTYVSHNFTKSDGFLFATYTDL